MKPFRLVVAALLIAVASLNLYGADAPKKLFVSLNSSSQKEAGMGLSIAYAMQDAGVQTTVLIGADALELAKANGGQNIFGPMNKTPRELIQGLVKKGGTVMVCGMCAKFADLLKHDVIEGVKIVNGTDVYKALFAAETRTLSF
jgi:predicted peroxiredoxin